MSDAEDVRKQKNELAKKELERRSNDEILIYNPTNADWSIRYGGYIHVVPHHLRDGGYGLGKLVTPRYIAENYIKHMVDHLIYKESDTLVAKAKAKYKGADWPREEERIALRLDNMEARKGYIKILWLGVKRKFGLDEVPGEAAGVGKPEDRRPQDEQIIDELEREVPVEPEVQPLMATENKEIDIKKKDLEEGVK